jgi:Pyridine nucleotide-disulphide oxidoreductase
LIVDDVMTETREPEIDAMDEPPSVARDAADAEVAVIGAGPHGLSAAVHLRREGVDTQVFGAPMSFWRSMPKGMRLRSNLSATNMIEPAGPLSLASYMTEIGEQFGHPISLRRFVEYGTWVQRNGVPDVDTRTVTRLFRDRGGFVLELDDGDRFTARRVVVACGIAPFESMPPGFDHLGSDLVSHTGHHDDLSRFEGKRVAVVGAGQSAFESSVLMNERGAEVELIARGSEIVWLRSWSPIHFMGRLGKVVYAPTDVGPLWYSRLVATPSLFTRLPRETQDRIASRSIRPACSYFVKVRVDGVRITMGTHVTAAEAAGQRLELTLSDGTTREVDHLMFGTGYKVNVRRYPFLSEGLLAGLKVVDGYPELRQGFESSVPSLHFLGAPAARSFGPIMRFVSGSWYGGTRLAQAVARERRGGILRRWPGAIASRSGR